MKINSFSKFGQFIEDVLLNKKNKGLIISVKYIEQQIQQKIEFPLPLVKRLESPGPANYSSTQILGQSFESKCKNKQSQRNNRTEQRLSKNYQRYQLQALIKNKNYQQSYIRVYFKKITLKNYFVLEVSTYLYIIYEVMNFYKIQSLCKIKQDGQFNFYAMKKSKSRCNEQIGKQLQNMKTGNRYQQMSHDKQQILIE